MRVLETLARIHTIDSAMVGGTSFAGQIQNQRVHLPWGTTLIVITGSVDDALLDELHQARRTGQNTVLIIAGRAVGVKEIQTRASYFGIPVIPITDEDELERWGRGQMVIV